MAEWKDVKNREKEEKAFTKETTDKGATEIEQFYPELYTSSGTCLFTNTLGSYLIPDLLTSNGVIVDLYDWSSPESLIEIYGVDLRFLLNLRDAKLVRICANLPIERYQAHSWLFPLLADSRTIFRSIRTPAFVAAIDPDFAGRVSRRKANLQGYFGSLPTPEIERLCGAVKSAHPPTNAESLASVLAEWLERLASFEPELTAEISDTFERHVIERAPELRRLQRLIVSPYTAYLGGMMKIERSKWAELFGEEGIDNAIIEGQVRLQMLNTYFSEVQLNLAPTDLTSEKIWNGIRDSERNKLIEHLGDTGRKADLLRVEEELRIGLVKGGDQDPTRESIQAYVTKLESEAENLRKLSDTLAIAGSVVSTFLTDKILVGFTIASGLFASKYLLGDRLKRVTEFVIPKLRVVRVLGKRDK